MRVPLRLLCAAAALAAAVAWTTAAPPTLRLAAATLALGAGLVAIAVAATLRRRALRLGLGVVAAGAALALTLALHEALRGERRDAGDDPLVARTDPRVARIGDAWLLPDAGGALRVRALGPAPSIRTTPGTEVVWENGGPPGFAPPADGRWRFAAFGDCRGGAGAFARLRRRVAASGAAFTVGLGDLVGMARTYQFEILRDQLAETGKPAFVLPGNHDLDPFGTDRPFARVFGPPRWTFVVGGVRFVAIDTARGHAAEEDVAWVEGLLAARDAAVRDVVLCSHYPVWPPTGRPDKPLPQDEPTTKRLQAAARAARALVLTGSYHAFDRTEHDGAVQVVTGGGGSKLEGPGGHHYVEIEVTPHGLRVEKVDVLDPADASQALDRVLVLRDEAAWVARHRFPRFLLHWTLAVLALGGLLAATLPYLGRRATSTSA
ncbi:MAG: metallophosphoesterase [Planctomycetes bacterium]|nr:metallophosphoesterase [Planctomycetota bacterium]